MNKFATVALLLLAAGLVVFIALTGKWRFSNERLTRTGDPLFRFDPSTIDSIEIDHGEKSFRLSRSGAGWTISGPVDDAASPEAVAAYLRTALDTIILDRIDAGEIPDEKNLATYGVLKSSLRLDFKGDGAPPLLFGKKSADGKRHYVSFDKGDDVYLIPDTLGTLTTLPPADFRDRRVLTHPPEAINRIHLRKGPAALELQRDGRGWWIVKPLRTKADDAAVAKLLEQLAAARIQAFPKTRQIDRPTGQDGFELALHAEGHPQPTVLGFASPATDAPFQARLLPRKTDILLAPSLADLAEFDIDRLRDRSVFGTNPDLVDLVRITANGSTRTITRKGDAWQAAPGAMEKFFATLAETKATSFLPATPDRLAALGLDDPAATIEMVAVLSENTPEAPAGEQTIVELAVGRGPGEGTAAIRAADSPEIMLAPDSLLDSLP